MGYATDEDMRYKEQALSTISFFHGSSEKVLKMIIIMHPHLRKYQSGTKPFKGLRIDTCANIQSIISQQQHTGYGDEFGLGEAVRPAGTTVLIGIGGRDKSIFVVRI